MKPRYLDFEKKRPQRTLKMREKMSSDEFRDKVETGARNNAMAFEDADERTWTGCCRSRSSSLSMRSRLPSLSRAQRPRWPRGSTRSIRTAAGTSQAEFFCFRSASPSCAPTRASRWKSSSSTSDRGGDGTLDRNEFLLAERMGFGAAAEELMQQCDKDGTGYISYTEFLGPARDRTSSGDTKSFIMAATMADEEKTDEAFPPLLLARADGQRGRGRPRRRPSGGDAGDAPHERAGGDGALQGNRHGH